MPQHFDDTPLARAEIAPQRARLPLQVLQSAMHDNGVAVVTSSPSTSRRIRHRSRL
jgi:hypothetical protein